MNLNKAKTYTATNILATSMKTFAQEEKKYGNPYNRDLWFDRTVSND